MMIPCAEFTSPNVLESTGRGRLQLTPQLALPVEHIEVDVSAGNVSQELVQGWAVGPRRTRAVVYDTPN